MSDETDLYWSCVRKKRLSDEKFAKKIAARCSEREGKRIYYYGCHACGGWHLTKRSPRLWGLSNGH